MSGVFRDNRVQETRDTLDTVSDPAAGGTRRISRDRTIHQRYRQIFVDVVVYRNQKVSITAINGDRLFVQRSGDNVAQNGMGWIHRDYVTWSEKSVEQYPPSTPMNPQPNRPMERNPAYQGNPWRGPSGSMSPVTMPGMSR